MDKTTGLELFKKLVLTKRSIDRLTQLNDLTMGEYMVLRRIKVERQGDVNNFKALKISEYLDMPAPAISRILNSLEGNSLIKRKINVHNRRSVIIDLTKKGEEALMKAFNKISEFSEGLVQRLGEDNALTLIELLEKTTNYIEEVKK